MNRKTKAKYRGRGRQNKGRDHRQARNLLQAGLGKVTTTGQELK